MQCIHNFVRLLRVPSIIGYIIYPNNCLNEITQPHPKFTCLYLQVLLSLPATTHMPADSSGHHDTVSISGLHGNSTISGLHGHNSTICPTIRAFRFPSGCVCHAEVTADSDTDQDHHHHHHSDHHSQICLSKVQGFYFLYLVVVKFLYINNNQIQSSVLPLLCVSTESSQISNIQVC